MQEISNKRLVLFLFGCMGARLGFTYVSKTRPDLLPIFGKLALLPAVGFMVIYLFKLRRVGAEVDGEVIWWDHLRPIHSLLWGMFAYLAMHKSTSAWMLLFIDTLIGLCSYLKFRNLLA
jgi:hypothetical protein